MVGLNPCGRQGLKGAVAQAEGIVGAVAKADGCVGCVCAKTGTAIDAAIVTAAPVRVQNSNALRMRIK